MTILELEQKTQLDRATIRYYEKEGLITPMRRENSYRDYSDTDAEEILKIKLLRQLDLPIHQIKLLQNGEADVADVLRHQAVMLEKQVKETGRAAAICKEISAAQTRYQDLNATTYLDKMKEAVEIEEVKPAEPEGERKIPYEQRVQYIEYHPVRRFVARILDYTLLRLLAIFFLVVIIRVRPFTEFLSNVVYYVCLLLSVPLQGLMIHYFATTPGKWIMGIRVLDYNGRKVDMHNAMQREWQALLYGYGLGIPFIRLWRLWRSYKIHNNMDPLTHDIGVELEYEDQDVWRKSAFALACVFIVVINCINASDVLKPKYRGNDLTVAEFAENFNYYAEVAECGFVMDPDGSWEEKGYEPFYFITEGESIQRITYQNSWTNVSYLRPLDDKMQLAMITAIASQGGFNRIALSNAIKTIDQYCNNNTAQFEIGNIEIQWNIQSVNCFQSNGTYYRMDNTTESSVSINLQIIIH